MLALERRNLILEKLQDEKRVVVSELSQLYGVSEETIRRDLDKLEKEGLAIKSLAGKNNGIHEIRTDHFLSTGAKKGQIAFLHHPASGNDIPS